jgi:DNA-binding GntR family transcriptional regulator
VAGKIASATRVEVPEVVVEQDARKTPDITGQIEDDIVARRILPGSRLDERLLAERFGVSRTPVREALVRLSVAGLVEIRRNQGAFVTEMTPSRLIGILEVMADLKMLAARLAARRMTIEEREALKALRDETAECVAVGDLRGYFNKATALHDAIYDGSHNEFLIETARNIRTCLCAYRRHLERMHLPVKTSYEENSHVVDAIVLGDSEEAEKWMRRHTELRREEMDDLITLMSQMKEPRRAAN